MNRMLTVDELCQELKVPRSWVYRQTTRNSHTSIPRIYVGKYLRFYLPEVIAWLRQQKEG